MWNILTKDGIYCSYLKWVCSSKEKYYKSQDDTAYPLLDKKVRNIIGDKEGIRRLKIGTQKEKERKRKDEID